MAGNRVEIVVVGKNDTQAGFRAAREDAKKLPERVEISVIANDETGKGVASARRNIGSLPDRVKIVITAEDRTENTFDEIEKRAKETAKRFGESGQGAGQRFGKRSMTAAAKALMVAEPILVGAASALLLGSAPVLGATMAGIIAGTVAGGTGILGGIYAGVRHPRVRQAGKELWENLLDNTDKSAEKLIDPLMKAMGRFDRWIEGRGKDAIDRLFGNLAEDIGPIADSVLDFIDSIVNGISVLMERGSILDGFGDSVRLLGDGFEDFFLAISQNGDAVASNLRMIAGFTADLISGLGQLLSLTSTLVQSPFFASGLFMKLAGEYESLSNESDTLNDANKGLTKSYKDMGKEASDTAKELEELAEEIKSQTDPAFNLIEKMGELEQAQLDYNEAVEKHGPKSKEAKQRVRELAEAALDMMKAAGDASGVIGGKLDPKMRALLRTAGLDSAAINNLERQLREAKSAAEALAGNYRVNVNTHYRVSGTSRGVAPGDYSRFSGVGGHAHGGIKGAANGATSSGMTWVGEQGPELAELPPGTRIHPAGQSRRMAQEMAGGKNECKHTLVLNAAPGSIEAAVWESLREGTRIRGGSVQLAVMGEAA